MNIYFSENHTLANINSNNKMAFLWHVNCEVMGTHVMCCMQELMGSNPSDIVIKFEQNGLYAL